MGNRHPEEKFAAPPAQSLRARLREAFYCSQFELLYQPKIELESGTVYGLEAQIHWQDPQNGRVGPDLLVPLLQDTGLTVEVERWAIRHALSQRLAWYIGGLRAPPITVPISEAQIRQSDFVRTVCDSLEAAGVGPHGLGLGVNEGLILGESGANVDKLRALGKRGVHVTVDDFGTRCASLDYLEPLPVHELKIDRAFVDRMPCGVRDTAVVSTMIALAHSANHAIVAEGVNTTEQASMLRQLKCDRIQGRYVCGPLPAENVAALLHSARAPASAAGA